MVLVGNIRSIFTSRDKAPQMTKLLTPTLALALAGSVATMATAEGELNLYSSRHYDTDERLYSDFTDATGITINRIEGKADELLARMQAEGANSPADILLTVDTSRLARAKDLGVLQSVESAILEERIPPQLQDTDNQWFGLSQRSRIIFYNTETVSTPPQTYAALADPMYKGQICIRSSSNEYNQTLLAAIVTHEGEDAARDWATGVVANMARDPQGGDTDQLRGIVSGECDISVSNTYYFARAIRTDVKGVSESIDQIGWLFPDQNGNGAHMNLSGGGIAAYAPNYDNAVKFLEYLASDQAQQYFSAGNDEYPVVQGVQLSPSVAKLGTFEADDVDLSAVAKNIATAQKIFNEVGWK
jgi:iron(III) transport system substrate-binding protein